MGIWRTVGTSPNRKGIPCVLGPRRRRTSVTFGLRLLTERTGDYQYMSPLSDWQVATHPGLGACPVSPPPPTHQNTRYNHSTDSEQLNLIRVPTPPVRNQPWTVWQSSRGCHPVV